MGRNFVFRCVLDFLFSTLNQLPQIIVGSGGVICHIKAVSVVIRTTLESSKKILPV